MKRENRVFFEMITAAKKEGYPPCGHGMRADYKNWKDGLI